MKVYTDSTKFAQSAISGAVWAPYDFTRATDEVSRLNHEVFGDKPLFETKVRGPRRWRFLLAAESSNRSQYDLLIEQRRRGVQLPDGLLCLSGAGTGLHGLRQRLWAAEAGNIHLSVHLLPDRAAIRSGIPFMVLAAVSVIEAIDTVPGLAGSAGIKWVNDILLRGAKVAGVLAYTEGAGSVIDAAVLGIGLNVETTPQVEATAFVPSVSSLSDHAPDRDSSNQGSVFMALIEALHRNYELLLAGNSSELLDRYRKRSVIVGREVQVCVDDACSPPKVIAEGIVEAIGDNLELHLEGLNEPLARGRLILKS